MRLSRWRLSAAVLLVFATGCASTRTVARPAAFPTAPLPPSVSPAPAEIARHLVDPSDVVRTATNLRGVHYRSGGDSPSAGFDCSGFIQYVFSLHHVDLPRTVGEQFLLGLRVQPREIREGDLVFFSTTTRGPSHVGLAIGNSEFVHAPSGSGAVRIERLDVPYWRDRIVGVKRVL